jgi:hypothetical protein
VALASMVSSQGLGRGLSKYSRARIPDLQVNQSRTNNLMRSMFTDDGVANTLRIGRVM